MSMSGQAEAGRAGRPRRVLLFTGIAIISILLLVFLDDLLQALLIIFAGILFGIFNDAIIRVPARRTRVPRVVWLVLLMLLIVALPAAITWREAPRIAAEVNLLGQAATNVWNGLLAHPWFRQIYERSVRDMNVVPLSGATLGRLTGIFGSAVEFLSAVVVIFFIGLFGAAQPGMLTQNALRLLPAHKRYQAREVIDSLATALRWWLLGRVLVMAFVGVLTAVGLAIIGVPLAVLLGVIAAVFAFVPYIGAIVSAVPSVIVGLEQSPATALYVVVVFIIVHVLEGYVISPLVQLRVVSMPPAFNIAVQVVMTVLFGVMGVLLATPLAVVGIILVQLLYVRNVLHEDVRTIGLHGRNANDERGKHEGA